MAAGAGGLILVLSACTGSSVDERQEGTAPPAEGRAAETGGDDGEERTVVVGEETIGSLDLAIPTSRSDNEKMLSHVGDFLVQANDEGQIVGMLAEEFSLSDDGLTWTFKLREGVPFHPGPNGEDYGEVTADDVKFSWSQWISEESTHSFKETYAAAVGNDLEQNFVIHDDYEFSITAAEPNTAFLNALCSCLPGMTIFPREYYESTAAEVHDNHPLGSGPWRYVDSQVGEFIEFEAFEDYWQGAPSADRLIIREVPDAAAALAQVRSGELDLALLGSALLGEAAEADLQLFAIDNLVNVSVFFGGAWWGTESELDRDAPWIQADDPEQGRAIREAMSLAIDREAILERLLHGQGELTYAPVIGDAGNPELAEDSWALPEYDPELAREKLAEGGYPDGFPVEVPLVQFGVPDTVRVGEAVAGMWEDIGLDVTRTPMTDPTQSERLDNMQSDGWAWVHPEVVNPEPSIGLAQAFLSDSGAPHKWNHPTIDEHYRLMQAGTTYEERAAAARGLMDDMIDQTLAIPLFNADMIYIGGDRVAAWVPEKGANFATRLWQIEFAE